MVDHDRSAVDRDAAELRPGQRSDENAVVRWVFLDGNRWTVVVGLSVLVFLLFVVLGVLHVIGVTESSLVRGIFTASITGVFTLVSITTTINQLVLSRILGSPETIGDRIESVDSFRGTASDMTGGVPISPTEPAAFMAMIERALRQRADHLASVTDADYGQKQRQDIEDVCTTLYAIAEEIDREIGADQLRLFRVLAPVLNNRFSDHIHTLRRIEAEHDSLTPAETDAINDLVAVLEEINRTRHYFKTLYLHEELADLSRLLLISGFPAVVASYVVILMYDGFATALGEWVLLLAVCTAMVIALSPLAILLSYSLRFITIARRTTTFGTFTPPEEMP